MLVSLKGDKAKKLAQVMSNPTCTKILEYLAGKDATETKIAEDLDLPLSTVHYNIQQLVGAKLVVVDEFHYSEKGREVNHYKLAKKYIIIAPDDDDPTFLERLKKFVPITMITLGLGVTLKTMQFFTGTLSKGSSSELTAFSDGVAPMAASVPLPEAAPMMKGAAAPLAEQAVENAADYAMDSAVGGASPEGARMMTAPFNADNLTNETVIEETINGAINTTQAVPVDQVTQPIVDDIMRQELAEQAVNSPMSGAQPAHWWQSSAIDYFILGALFVIFVFVIAELVNHLRAKRAKR